MNTNNQTYCKLMYVLNHGYPENSSLNKPRYESVSKFLDKNVYVEEYDDFDSLIARINFILERVIEGYKKQNIDPYSTECSFPELIVENKYGESIPVGVSTFGWNISVYFFSHLMKYFEAKYGQQEGQKKYSQLVNQKDIWFYADYQSEATYASACNLVSEETAHVILKEFLDTGKTEFSGIDFSATYEREIAKRNY